MSAPFDDLHCEYGWGSGSDQLNAAWIARRWRDKYGTALSDSDFYVCGFKDGEMKVWGPWPNIVSALWRSTESGRVYAADASQGSVHVYDAIWDPDPAKIRRTPLGFGPEGIWGLDEENLFCWGIRQEGPRDQRPHLARFDGSEFVGMPCPDFFITKMHGIAPDLIYAAGRGGMARWDGRGWTEVPMPTGEVLSDVFVAGPDEIYATGHNGSLLEGSANGWTVVTRTVDDRLPYACVAKFAGELYVGGGPQGLFRRVGKSDQLELIKPNLTATSFEAHEGCLLITVPFAIVGTPDGQTFNGAAINSVLTYTANVDIAEA